MATTRLTNSGFGANMTKYDDFLVGYPPKMATPTAADGGTGTTATVSFTAVSGATGYRAISNPGSFTGTASSSPITVSGLSSGTAYTFQVQAQNSVGYGAYSDASNSITPVNPSSFESIATVTASGGETSLNFTSISNAYKSLQIRGISKNDSTSFTAGSTYIGFNSDTNSNYAYHWIFGNGSAAGADATASTNAIASRSDSTTNRTAYNNMYGTIIFDIIDYASTTKNKTIRGISGYDTNGEVNLGGRINLFSGLWLSTSAITSINLTKGSGSPGFAAGSTFALYGIKG